jgi:hypothetical protein
MSGRFGSVSLSLPVVLASLLPALLPGRALAQEDGRAAKKEFPRFRVDGQFRLRFEADGRTAGIDPDLAVLSRVRVGGGVLLADWIDVYAQLQDSRAWGTERNTLTDGSADALDLHQGFAVLGSGPGFKAKLGRQEVVLGDERLVGAVGWTNTGRAFDGARLSGSAGQFDWSAFWMNVQERDSTLAIGLNPQLNQGVNDDGWLIGGFGSTALGDVNAELTFLVDRYAITEESYTTNLRVHRGPSGLLIDASGAYQTGPDREAWFASARLGWAFDRISMAGQLDYLSGDPDPDDGETKAFNTLYATNHKFYGYMDYFLALPAQLDQAGLVDAALRGSWAAGDDVTVRLDLHRFWTAEERFGETELGTETDLVGIWHILPAANLAAGGGLFLPEPLITRLLPAFAAGDDTTWWGFVQLTLKWP